MKSIFPLAALMVLITGCKPPQSSEPPSVKVTPVPRDVASNEDGALTYSAFIFVGSPASGDRVAPGFSVKGSSRTFESTVNWRLKARDGSELSAGHTTGGGVDGPGAFAFPVAYKVTERQIGHLEIYEEDASDGEGNPPARNVIPLVLNP